MRLRAVRFWVKDLVSCAGTLITGGALCMSIACAPTPASVLRGSNGEILDIPTLDAILNDADLTTEEKRQELLDLGVPATLVDTLIRAAA